MEVWGTYKGRKPGRRVLNTTVTIYCGFTLLNTNLCLHGFS